MNFLGGGERHSTADHSRSRARASDSHKASPGDPLNLGRPGDERGFVHRTIGRALGGIARSVIGSVPIVGGIAGSIFDQTIGRALGSTSVPQAASCPPGFIATPTGCVPRASPALRFTGPLAVTRRDPRITAGSVAGRPFSGAFPQPTEQQALIRQQQGLAIDPAAGVAVMGRFGAGFEPEVIMTDTRRCGRGAVLGIDGLCYNRRDLRNSDRFWPRGRRPLLTGGEMRAISTASSAAKKLQRKEKQLQELGLLKRPARGRRAAPAGHRVQLTHDGGSQH